MTHEIAKGALWMLLLRVVDRGVGIVSTALLARLLVPGDFGLVAMAMSVIAMIELATSFSFDMALIQKPDVQRTHYDTAWTLNIIVAASGALATAALAPAAAWFYQDPRIAPVMFAIGAGWLVSGFDNVGTVNFRRNMDFSTEFRLLASRRLITFVVTMVAALTLRSYWALVIGMITGRVFGVVLSYVVQPFRPRLSLACARELMSFSGWLLASNLAATLLTRLPQFVVGRMFGAQALGTYTVGSEIAQMAHTELVAPLNRAMFPGFSRLVKDPSALRQTCIQATAAVLIIVFPVSTGLAVLAEPFVRILLGSQWQDAVPVIQILAFSGAAIALASNNVIIYTALGRPKLTTVILLVRLGVLALAILLLARQHGVVGIAYAELASTVCSLAASLPILFRVMDIRWRDYAAITWRPVVASGLMGVLVFAAAQLASPGDGLADAMARLVVGVPVGALLYPLFMWLLWQLCGRPEGAEAVVVRRVHAYLAGVLQRRAQ